jgi:putative flippase GtrA
MILVDAHRLKRGEAMARARQVFLSPNARPVRFAITGGLAGLTQLVLLELFSLQGWHALTANLTAFLLAAQLNFVLSRMFTWRDRQSNQAFGRRWLAFHGSIASMAVINMVVFAAAGTFMPELAASAAGILAAAAGNFLIGDRLVFVRQENVDSDGAHEYRKVSAA